MRNQKSSGMNQPRHFSNANRVLSRACTATLLLSLMIPAGAAFADGMIKFNVVNAKSGKAISGAVIRIEPAASEIDELQFKASKVGDVVSQGMLATELDTQLLAPQPRPELALGVGHVPAQGTGVDSGFGGGLVLHGCLTGEQPPSLPSPRGGRGQSGLAPSPSGGRPGWGHAHQNHGQFRTGLPVFSIPRIRSCVFGCTISEQNAWRSSVIR